MDTTTRQRWAPPAPNRFPAARMSWWARNWLAVSHLALDLLLAIPYLVLTVFLLVSIVLVPVFGIGLVPLVAVLGTAIVVARLDLLRLESVSGVPLDWMGTTPAGSRARWRRLVLGGRQWRAMAWVAIQSMWGFVTGIIALVSAAVSLALVSSPLYVWFLPDHEMYWPGGGITSGPWWPMLIFLIGVIGMILTPLLASGLLALNVLLARLLLTRRPTNSEKVKQLNQRVQTLTQTRAATVDSVEAERQRIERDLHDGPQQRLVAIAMDLGLARERLKRDPETARELMDKAHSAAKEAVIEMRQVARGIHPPILTDRGLDAALSALAASAPVPVSVQTVLRSRPSPTVEAIAYFCVSEGLTNVAKHARASRARVLVSGVGEWLRIEIEDDGRGGAQPGGDGGEGGTGLRGLADRVAAIDGAVHLSSPAGGPTVLTIHLPLHPRETGSTS